MIYFFNLMWKRETYHLQNSYDSFRGIRNYYLISINLKFYKSGMFKDLKKKTFNNLALGLISYPKLSTRLKHSFVFHF